MGKLLKEFMRGESAAGVLLLTTAVLSMFVANSSLHEPVAAVWHFYVAGLSILHWINDGLMAIFFLSVGLEIKHELVAGQLSSVKRAALPVAAAVGGMIFPAVFYLMFNHDSQTGSGWGIPIATDIAFVAGILALLGRRVPPALKVFVVSLAVVDDIGAVLVIAFFYTANLRLEFLGLAFLLMLALTYAGRRGLRLVSVFLVVGALLWWLVLRSGIHASIAGVLLAMTIPGDIGHNLEKKLRPVVGFLIMPVFALANAGVPMNLSAFSGALAWAVLIGLFVGKPVGIVLASWIAQRLRWADLPENVRWSQVVGSGFLGGIGFTMALFMAHLALPSPALMDAATLGILAASALSAVVGVAILVRK